MAAADGRGGSGGASEIVDPTLSEVEGCSCCVGGGAKMEAADGAFVGAGRRTIEPVPCSTSGKSNREVTGGGGNGGGSDAVAGASSRTTPADGGGGSGGVTRPFPAGLGKTLGGPLVALLMGTAPVETGLGTTEGGGSSTGGGDELLAVTEAEATAGLAGGAPHALKEKSPKSSSATR